MKRPVQLGIYFRLLDMHCKAECACNSQINEMWPTFHHAPLGMTHEAECAVQQHVATVAIEGYLVSFTGRAFPLWGVKKKLYPVRLIAGASVPRSSPRLFGVILARLHCMNQQQHYCQECVLDSAHHPGRSHSTARPAVPQCLHRQWSA